MELWNKWENLPYAQKLRWRIRLLVLMAAFGLILLPVGIWLLPDCGALYNAMGCALAASSIAQIYRLRRVLRDPEQLRRREVIDQDERNRLIMQKTWSYSGYLLYFGLYVGIIIASVFNRTVALTLAWVMVSYVAVMVFMMFYLNKRY